MPYDANSLAELTLKIIKGQFSPLPNHYSKGLVMLVNCLLCVDQNKRPSANDILRLPIIKSRIKNFLSDFEYNDEFSHTILHKFNPFKKQPSKDSSNSQNYEGSGSSVSITVSVNDERTSKVEESKISNKSKDKKLVEEKKQTESSNSPRKGTGGISPRKVVGNNLSPRKETSSNSPRKGSASPKKETPKTAEEDKKLKVLMKSINTMMKQPETGSTSNTQVEKIEDKDNNDYINVHKMMVEMSV
jgi:hypothetical protein